MSTSDIAARIHYYHAEANAFGGHIEKPFHHLIPVQAPLSLPAVGGFATSRVERFRLDGIVSFEAAYTQVSGSSKTKTGPWSTMAQSVIEGLNVLNVFTADRIVAQVATEHPADGYYPRVTFAGTQFKNVHIAGSPVTIDLDLSICQQDPQSENDRFPKTPCIRDPRFLDKVAEQRRAMLGGSAPGWAKKRYYWDQSSAGKERIVCSVVKGIVGKFSGDSFGNVFEVPHFGRGFLGELLVDGTSYRLVLFRFELGCANYGELSGVDAGSNGSTEP